MSEEASTDQTHLSVSPTSPPPLSLSGITGHEPLDRRGHSDVTDNLTNPISEGEGQEGSTGFLFDEKDREVEVLSKAIVEQNEQRDQSTERQDSHIGQGISEMTCCVKGICRVYILVGNISRLVVCSSTM